MPRKVSELEKKAILESFIAGEDIKDIAKIYKYTPATISAQLKKILNNEDFQSIKLKNIKTNKKNFNQSLNKNNKNILHKEKIISKEIVNEEIFKVVPIIGGLDFENQKELTTEPIKKTIFPEVVYLIVDKKIELVPKLLKEYSKWSYLPEEDLERTTLEIFADQKHAKKLCSKNEKIIKVPNPKIFIMASKSLRSKGITRIIFDNLLLSL